MTNPKMNPVPDPEKLDEIIREAQLPKVITAPRVKTPMLTVLIGSTPARAALELMYHMLTLSREDRQRASFVFIDTDDDPDELVQFRRAHQGMFKEFIQRIAVPAHPESASWPPPPIDAHTLIPPKMPQFYASGAGGIRNNGHVALAFNQSRVLQTLQTAISALEQINDEPGSAAITEIQVNVVAFMGGGTGSGILPDIGVMLRSILIQRSMHHRLNFICIMPENIRGATPGEVRWRKSNAVASILEIVAHSVAKDPQNSGYYTKYLMETPYRVQHDALANEIYLIANTGLGDATQVARLVGLELFERLCDASGIGFLEHSKWVDRRALGNRDMRGIPTPFGISCSLEAVFPAQATATAFAQISASYLLRSIIGQKPPMPDTSTFAQGWMRELQDTADFNAAEGKRYSVRHSSEIPESEFQYASDADLNRLWDLQRDRTRQINDDIITKVNLKEQDELQYLQGQPPEFQEDRNLTPVARQLQFWRRQREKYRYWIKLLDQAPSPAIAERPNDLEAEYLLPVARIPVPEIVQRQMRQGKARQLADTYYRIMRDTDEANRHNALDQMARRLEHKATELIVDGEKWYQQEQMEEQSQALYRRGTTSEAWKGRLDRPHPHQRHIFDLPDQRTGDRERNLAVERLYYWATFPDLVHDQARRQGRGFPELITEYFRDACIAYMRDQTGTSQDAAALDVVGRDIISQRVIAFFENYYLRNIRTVSNPNERGREGLLHFNLFQLLEFGTGKISSRERSSQLRAHLGEMRPLLREMLNFAPALQGGQEDVESSLYLAMRWEDDAQKSILDLAIREMGQLASDLEPMTGRLSDPHRMQISFGRHGISLSTIPEFHQEQNSMMGDYLNYQAAWFGRDPIREDKRILATPDVRYGSNGAPVHASREMERLVCSQFGTFVDAPSGSRDRSLRGHIIRDAYQPTNIPGGFDAPLPYQQPFYGPPPGGAPNGYGPPPGGAPNGYGPPPGGAPNGYGAAPGGVPNGYGAAPGGVPNGYGAAPGGAPNGYGAAPGGAPNGYGAPLQNAPGGMRDHDGYVQPPGQSDWMGPGPGAAPGAYGLYQFNGGSPQTDSQSGPGNPQSPPPPAPGWLPGTQNDTGNGPPSGGPGGGFMSSPYGDQ